MNLVDLKRNELDDANFAKQMSIKIKIFEERIDFFNWIAKFGIHWQQNPTPLSIVRKMVGKTILDDKKILVLFNIEFLQVLVEEQKVNPENIYYIADNELEYLSAIKIYKVQSYKLSDYSASDLKKLITGVDMKFDLVFSNPPYTNNVDIKILNEIIDVAHEFVIVHPSTWVIDIKGKSKLYQDFKKNIDRKVSSIELFNGNPVFDIGLFVPCSITHVNTKQDSDCSVKFFNESYTVKHLSEVNKFGKNWETIVYPFFQTIKAHIETHKSVWDYNTKDLTQDYFYCQFAAIRGHELRNNPNKMHHEDFYTMCMKDSDKNKGIRQFDLHRKNNPTPTFEFKTEQELNNFLEYCKTDFARFCLALYKDGQNLSGGGAMEMIPWLDFTEEWDDEKLFEKFDVSQELQDYIREFLPDYYGIRK